MASLDPYHEWLGIPPGDQPPDHYRLLGLAPFESDPARIALAAKRQMARVKAFQTGTDSELAQRLLKEIALARNDLLDPKKKAEYDRRLGPPPAPPVVLAPPRQADAAVIAQQASAAPPPPPPASNARAASKGAPSWMRASQFRLVPVVLGGIVGTLLAVGIIYFIRGREVSTAERMPLPAATSHPTLPPAQPDPQGSTPDPSAVPPPKRDLEEDAQQREEEASEQSPAGADISLSAEPSEDDASMDATQPGDDERSDSPSEKSDGAEPTPTKEAPEPDEPAAEAPARPAKLPVPDEAAQREAEQRVRELLKSELSAATTPETKAALVTRLVTLGRETTGDPAARFVLFRLAYELTASVGDWAKALTIVDAMGEHFDADVLSIRADVLGRVMERLPATPQTADAVKAVADAWSQCLDDAVAADNYEAANRLLRSARVMARQVGNPAMTRELGVREREIARLERAFNRVRTAVESVARGSADAADNIEAGRWYSLEKGDWEKGLPLLAKGSNAALADLARRDLANPEDLSQQIELAEDWLQAAQNEPGSTASRMVSRARHWCERAVPKLDEAMKSDDYETAGRLLAVAVCAFREAEDQQRLAELTSRQQQLEHLKQRFVAVQAALDVLADNPEDAAANLEVGRWYCVEKGDWEKGLPLLAQGADPALADLARRDAAAPRGPTLQLKLADDWWNLGEKEKDRTKSALWSRAAYWYEQALPQLTGLDKIRVEKRLETFATPGHSSSAESASGRLPER